MDAELERLFDARVGAATAAVQLQSLTRKVADSKSLRALEMVLCLVLMKRMVVDFLQEKQ